MKNNAILLCGGIGRRMSPIPRCNKSLLNIRGEINLKRIVRILYNKGIKDIVLATNPISSSELFSVCHELATELEGIGIEIAIARDYTEGCNNIVTMRAVADHIENTYIIETDQLYLEDKLDFIQSRPLEVSYVFTQRRSEEDWGVMSACSAYNEDRVLNIVHCNPGNFYYCLSGISYFTGVGSEILRDNLRSTTRDDIYWEEVITPNIPLYEWKSREDYSIEFDDISDLIDKKLMLHDDIADLIDDNHSAIRLNSMTNFSYKVSIEGKEYALRLPGYGTDEFINHEREQLSEFMVPTSLRPESKYFSGGSVKLSEYLTCYADLFYVDDIYSVLKALSTIHDLYPVSEELENLIRIDLMDEVSKYERIADYPNKLVIPMSEYSTIRDWVSEYLSNWFKINKYELVHRDLVPSNIQVNESREVKFIDWEYAGLLHRYWDLASLCCEFSMEYDYDIETLLDIVQLGYLNIDRDTILRWIIVVDFVWSSWSLAKYSLGDDVYEYGLFRYKRALELLKSIQANTSSVPIN